MKNTAASPRSLLPAFALILVVFFLIFMALRIVFPPASLSRPTSTLRPPTVTITRTPAVTPTFTPTSTITRTPRPTWTQRPTATRTITPTGTQTETPPLPIMPTWAKPISYNDLYELRPWLPEDANWVIELMQAYPDTLYPNPDERQSNTYNTAFTYAAYALREALLRYPGDPLTEQWRWGLAYDLAYLNDPGVVEAYAALIQGALDSRQTPLDNLPDWFSQHEDNLSLSIHRFTPPPGYLSRQLIEVKATGGAAYLWLVESPEKVALFPVTSYFDFAHAIQVHYSAGDLTGDGIEELVIYADPFPGQSIPERPQVFSLTTGLPPQLSFAPQPSFDLGTEYRVVWNIDQGALRSTISIYPACAVQLTKTYHWDGMQLTPDLPEYRIEPNPSQLGYCERVIDHVASQWGAQVVIPMMEALLPAWPPMADPDGKSYPADARDEWRYRLGVYHALAGNFEQAQSTLTDLITLPTATDSRWIALAQQFLEAYASPSDLYTACLTAQYCDPRQALQQLLAATSFDDISLALDALISSGVTVRSSGNFDFDRDREAERWVLLRHHPQDRLEFWILARWDGGVQALFIDQVDSTQIRPYYHEPVDSTPITQIEPKKGFVLERLPVNRKPYLTFKEIEFIPTTYTLDALQSAIDDLFAGTSPATIRDRLEDLEKSDRFNCLNYRICDRFYYTLGLTYELSGDVRPAIDTYIKLWWENSDSPFTLIARLKLKQLPFTSPTPSITTTPTPSATRTPDPNITPSITPTDTATPTESLTPTETITPTP